MTDRKQKVEALLADFRVLRRSMAFRMAVPGNVPRITPSQWGVLMSIEEHGESTIKDVAKALRISSSAATQLVDGLVASGYLIKESSTKDRRIVRLTLSKKTKAKVDRMKKHALQRFLKIFGVLSDAEFNRYIALNKKIVGGCASKKDL
jgi:DNA-binding MarR family transcriptional regulator